MQKSWQNRRKYLRIATPLNVRAISKTQSIYETQTKDISPLGLRFEVKKNGIAVGEEIELKIEIPGVLNAIHSKARVIWKKKTSTKDDAPYDIGCEFAKIEEDNKNSFLKYFCDLLYGQKNAKEKKEA